MTCLYTSRVYILFSSKQKSTFFFRHLTLKKALEGLLQNIYMMLDLLYHKRNPHITTIVDGRIFKHIFKTLN